MSVPQRRAADHRALDIGSMIAEENDPRQRAQLIVLNNINNSLLANTKMTTEVASKLDDHLTRYEEHTKDEAALINRGIGAWKIIAWVLGVAQAALMGSAGYVSADLKELHGDLHAGQVVDVKTLARVDELEDRVKVLSK